MWSDFRKWTMNTSVFLLYLQRTMFVMSYNAVEIQMTISGKTITEKSEEILTLTHTLGIIQNSTLYFGNGTHGDLSNTYSFWIGDGGSWSWSFFLFILLTTSKLMNFLPLLISDPLSFMPFISSSTVSFATRPYSTTMSTVRFATYKGSLRARRLLCL